MVMQIIEPVVSLQCGEINLDVAMKFREQGDDLLILLHGLGCSKESFDGAFVRRNSATTRSGRSTSRGTASPAGTFPVTFFAGGLCRRYGPGDHAPDGRPGLRATLCGWTQHGWRCRRARCRWRIGITSLVSIDGNLIGRIAALLVAASRSRPWNSSSVGATATSAPPCAIPPPPMIKLGPGGLRMPHPRALHAAARSLVEWSDSGKLLEQFNAIEQRAFLYGERDDKEYPLPRL